MWELAHAAAIGPTHCQGRQQGHRREFGPCHVTPYLRIGHLGAGRTARTAPWLAEAPGLRRYMSTGWVHPDTVAWIASPIMATSFTAVGQGSRAPRLGSTGAGAPTQREGGSRGSRLSAEWAFLSAAEGTVSPGCMRARWSGERHQQARLGSARHPPLEPSPGTGRAILGICHSPECSFSGRPPSSAYLGGLSETSEDASVFLQVIPILALGKEILGHCRRFRSSRTLSEGLGNSQYTTRAWKCGQPADINCQSGMLLMCSCLPVVIFPV